MEITPQQETPDEGLISVVYIASSMDNAHRLASLLIENGVQAYIIPDPLPHTFAFFFPILYKVRVAVPIEQEKEAQIIIEAHRLKASDVVRTAVGDFRKALIWSIELALLTFAISLLYHQNIWEINFAAVILVWILSFFLISLILGHNHRKSDNKDNGS